MILKHAKKYMHAAEILAQNCKKQGRKMKREKSSQVKRKLNNS